MPQRHIHAGAKRSPIPQPGTPLPRCHIGLPPLPGAALMALLAVGFTAVALRAELRDSFETPDTSWQLAEADSAVQMVEHRRTFSQKHQGQGCEYVHVRAGTGTYTYLTHAIPAARIIDELTPSVWVKADRPGVRLMARVVLPRSPFGQDGQPLTALLRGDSYREVGNWQQLTIANMPLLMTRELAMLRTQFGSQVDAREAYIDLIVLNAYGGAGSTRLWIDDLSVEGIAQAEFGASQIAGENNAQSAPSWQASAARGTLAAAALPQAATAGPLSSTTELQGDVLLVEGRPRFVRAVEHRGERFDFLQSLGFNAIRLAQPPTAAQLEESRQLGLWLIAPPPLTVTSGSELTGYGSVIAWDAGEGLVERDLEGVRQLIANTRVADPLRRPVLSIPRTALLQYSRLSDIVAIAPGSHAVVAGHTELDRYRAWLEERRRLLRPAVACWAVVPTQLPLPLVTQWKALGPDGEWSDAVEPQHLHLLAYQAVSAGARGLLFASRTPLDQHDAATALRATALQCLNQQLNLLEPWVAAGNLSQEFEVSDPRVSVALLKTERSVLAVLTKCSPQEQYVSPPMTPRPVRLVVRGVPASAHAFTVSPIGLNTLRAERLGGMRLELDRFRHSAVVMISHDPLAINHVSQVIREQRQSAARTRRELVARQFALTRETLRTAGYRPLDAASAQRNLEQAEAHLRRSELLLDAGDDRSSVGAAGESLEFVAAVRRDAWQSAASGFPSPTSSPACAAFASLPLHWGLADRLRGAQWGGNQLPGGNMEDLGFMQAAGWQHERSTSEDIDCLVELTPQAPRAGSYSLRLAAMPTNPQTSRLILEQPAITIHSAPVPLRAGQLVQIRGWVKVKPGLAQEASVAAAAPLIVYDSLGGQPLAQAVTADNSWREFVAYRMATADSPVVVSLALRSYGEAMVDDVTVVPLQQWGTSTSGNSPPPASGESVRR